MSSPILRPDDATRRGFFAGAGLRAGAIAMGMLGASRPVAAASTSTGLVNPPLPGFPHHKPTAKALIYLHMNGAPSQIDTWDYKPVLKEYFNKDLPESVRRGQRLSTMTSGQQRFPVAPSKFTFKRSGKCGTWANTDILPYTARIVDDITVIKTVNTNAINHDPACTFVMTGSEVPGKASIGSWLAYGLGSESNNLPAFVVFTPRFPDGSNGQALFTRMWSSGFLPSSYNGVALRGSGDPVLYLGDPPGVSRPLRRRALDTLDRLNQQIAKDIGDPETLTRIAQYEMAYRMQSHATDAFDLKQEPAVMHELYGTNPGHESFANNCLLARRLAERGVRYIQLFHWGWDSHGDSQGNALNGGFTDRCKEVDQPMTALLKDLKQRGLLEDTLVVWGGEFGRTPMLENRGGNDNPFVGRDHNPGAFTLWMAGGGVKGGLSYGETDPIGYESVINKVSVHDLHATMMQLLGFDHEKFSYLAQGVPQRLSNITKTGTRVVRDILA